MLDYMILDERVETEPPFWVATLDHPATASHRVMQRLSVGSAGVNMIGMHYAGPHTGHQPPSEVESEMNLSTVHTDLVWVKSETTITPEIRRPTLISTCCLDNLAKGTQFSLAPALAGTTANFFIDVYGTVLLGRGIGYSSNITHIIREQNIYNMIYVVHDGILGLNVFIADALLVWRYYVFWNGTLLAILVPIILLVIEIVIVFQALKYLIQRDTPVSDPVPVEWYKVSSTLSVLNKAYYLSTFAINIILSIAISWTIWRMSRPIQEGRSTPLPKYSRIAHIILESGIIYSMIILLAMVPAGGILQSLSSAALLISIGLVPTTVVILLTLGKTVENLSPRHTGMMTVSAMRFGSGPSAETSTQQSGTIEAINVVLDNSTLDEDIDDRAGIMCTKEKETDSSGAVVEEG
ncbi:hypothetical protein GLOTRDRAFT_90605 [Gloeophyllum trabeum ATCC 11539]|uniref:Uncharacterized protein n=1 Tax=Gloeophyllum trabeum (strain ATCC 11539 / FP-39264 / Madison 617) TaxID=670483 RepID=S7RZF2_GLOTA|nr:uncharacterized protein GLOTRDRAFT_90605 [Gloeophyllum trabeum ATCC 11539]EPQ58824.1 hypothetical protein GLOTRDRAFT_90605 [Gloeophyllum trabeum ATCC 11539]